MPHNIDYSTKGPRPHQKCHFLCHFISCDIRNASFIVIYNNYKKLPCMRLQLTLPYWYCSTV